MTDIQVFYTGAVVKCSDARKLGLKRYFTGKPCKHGHVDERIVSSRQCVQCYKTPDAKARKAEYDTKRYEENKQEVSDYNTEYYVRNSDRIKMNAFRYRSENIEAVRERGRAYFRTEAGLLHLRVAGSKRRSLINGASGEFTRDDVKSMLYTQNGKCAAPWCRVDLSNGYDVDHIMPISRGGSNWPSNLQCLCARCNRSKGAKTMEEWIEWRVVLGLPVDAL